MKTESQHKKEKLEKLSMPGEFINSYSVALSYVDVACQSHHKSWELIRFCQEHISGKKPIAPEELKAKKMSWVYNYNYNKARAKIEKGVAESTSKISSSISLGYATFRNYKEEDKKDNILSFLNDDQKRGIVSAAIGYALTSTLSKETRLSSWMNEIEYPSFAFGYCAMIFSKYDWMPSPTHPLNIAFKPNTKPEAINSFIVFRSVEASELYERWVDAKNENTKLDTQDEAKPMLLASSGWNLIGLENVLFSAFKGKVNKQNQAGAWEQTSASKFEDVELEFRNNGGYVIHNTETVHIAKIFIKELNGSLSEIYIPYQSLRGQVQVTTTSQVAGEILFKKNHGTYKQEEHIVLIRDSGFTETGSIQDYRGIAKFSVEDSIRYNRVRNGIGNKMIFVGSPMFESPTGQVADKFKVTVSQGFVLLPTSHNLIEKQPSFDIGSHINVLRFEESEFSRDTQHFDATIQGRLTSRPNKGEVQRVTEEVEFTDAAKNNIKLRDYSAVFYQVMKKLATVNVNETDPGYSGKKDFMNP